jgi:hypothetical protein
VNNNWKGAGGEAIVACTEIFREGLRKTTINLRIVSVPAENRTRHLSNTSQMRYLSIELARSFGRGCCVRG